MSKFREWCKGLGPVILMVMLLGGIASYVLVGCQVEEPIPRTSANYGWVNVETVALTGTGADGSATASGTTDAPIRGHIYAVNIDYQAGLTTTTDITLALTSPALTIMTKSNSATDAWFYPAVQQTDSAAAGTSTYDRVPVSGQVTVSAAQTNSNTVASVTIYWGE